MEDTRTDQAFDLTVGELETELPEHTAARQSTFDPSTCTGLYCC